MNRSIKSRIAELEQRHPERTWKAIFQDFDDPTLWHPDSRQNDQALTWDQIIAKYPDHDFILVTYSEDKSAS